MMVYLRELSASTVVKFMGNRPKEETTVRENMMLREEYRPYCPSNGRCSMPRVDRNFRCPECRAECQFDPEFFKRYKAHHNL